MGDKSSFLQIVRKSAGEKVLFLPHAVKQMTRPERMITAAEVQQVIEAGEIIEDYPDDIRGHSCLMLGSRKENQPIHLVCSPQEDFLSVITAYLPDKELWTDDFKERKP